LITLRHLATLRPPVTRAWRRKRVGWWWHTRPTR